jgi:hypothetical protein
MLITNSSNLKGAVMKDKTCWHHDICIIETPCDSCLEHSYYYDDDKSDVIGAINKPGVAFTDVQKTIIKNLCKKLNIRPTFPHLEEHNER